MSEFPKNIYISDPLHEKGLSALSRRLFAGGVQTLGELTALSSSDLRERYKATPRQVEKVNSVLQEFGLKLNG